MAESNPLPPVYDELYERVLPDELDEAGRRLRDALVSGLRRKVPGQPSIEAPDGTLNGPFGVFLFAPNVGYPLQELGAALRTSTSLDARERELATISVAAELGSDYELSVHIPVALAAGVTQSEIRAAVSGDPFDDARDNALVRFSRAHARHIAPREEFAALTRHYDRHEVFEILTLVNYYRALASMMDLLRIQSAETLADVYSTQVGRRYRPDAEYNLALLMEEREIRNVLLRLASCVDSLDFEGLASLYAKDGELVTPWGSHKGREGLAAHVRKDIGVYKALHHVSAGHEIDVIPGANRARARMTLLATHVIDDQGTRFSTSGGHYEVALVRENGLWRLSRVQIVPAWTSQTG